MKKNEDEDKSKEASEKEKNLGKDTKAAEEGNT